MISVHYKSADADAAKTLMLATAKKWTEKKWWNEGSMSSLAKVAFESRFWKEAAKWYEEAVRENERSGSRRWNWRNTRSGYYGFLARAHVRLGNTDAAVDAASAAVVTWGNDQRNRKTALKSLRRVLAGVPDLDGYVKRWDAKVADTGLDAPLIRKYLGIVYLEQGNATKALAQLLLARELQPTDDDVHKRILSAYDRLGDKTGAIQALKTSITMSPSRSSPSIAKVTPSASGAKRKCSHASTTRPSWAMSPMARWMRGPAIWRWIGFRVTRWPSGSRRKDL